jgi:hypothetical protein
VRAWGDVAGGGITACMHRVKGGEFMHTEFESNKCVNGNGGGLGYGDVGRAFMLAYFAVIGCVVYAYGISIKQMRKW